MSYAYDSNDRLTSRVGGSISDTYSYSDDPYLGNIMVASNAIETDSIFHRPVVLLAPGADSTVTRLNGARYMVLRPYVGALSVPATMSITQQYGGGVTFNTRTVSLNVTTGLTSSLADGFNTASPSYNSEALEYNLYNPASGTRYTDHISLHATDSVSFSNSTLNSAFGRKYYYDAAGRISLSLNQGAGTQQTYQYDSYGELSTVYNQSGCYATGRDPNSGITSYCGTTTSTNSYTYDAAGNRTDLGATYYLGNRLALFSGGWYTYDADGNVNQKYGVNPNPSNQQFYWNAENRLDSLKYNGYYNVTYKYNALGKPVLKYRQGALDRVWLWDGDAWLAEFNASNQRVSEYLYAGLDQPYASVEGATNPSSIQYHEQDELGNVLGTHTGTSVTESISYDPWGVPSYSGDLSSRTMWKGLMWEGGPAQGDVVGLSYVRGRWYDPQAGRFIQEDPMGVDGGINVYTFAGDDPVNGSDPSGMDEEITCETTYTYGWVNGHASGVSSETHCTSSGGGELTGGGYGSGAPGGDGGGGGGGSGPGQPTTPPEPSSRKTVDKSACTAAVVSAVATGVGDALFFTGVGSGIRFFVVASREAELGAMFARGAAQGLTHEQTAAALRGIGSASIVGAAHAQWGSDAILGALANGASNWRDFVPGLATYRGYEAARNACSSQ